MNTPLISICVTNYNYEKFIGETIKSVLNQTYENFEIIIIDNASTDKSIEIIQSFDDPRIRFYKNEENIPLYQNLNKAQNLAQGEFIALLHSDDLYEANFLEEVVKAYNKYPNQKVFVTGVYFYRSENHSIPWHPYKIGGLKSRQEVFLELINSNNIGNGVNVIYHKSCLQQVGMFSEDYKFAADYDYWFRLAKLYDFVYIPKVLTKYRIHSANLTHKVNQNLEMVRESHEIYINNLVKSPLSRRNLIIKTMFFNSYYDFKRAFFMGIKYNSGKLSRNMLNFYSENFPAMKKNPYWNFVYVFSFLIGIRCNLWNKFISFVFRAVFWPYSLMTKIYKYKLLTALNIIYESEKCGIRCLNCFSAG